MVFGGGFGIFLATDELQLMLYSKASLKTHPSDAV